MTYESTPQAPVKNDRWWRKLGPGLITGAADDDPSGIATYSQGCAQYGYDVAWTVLITYPLMVGIQLASARIGRITGKGLTENFSRFCPRCRQRRVSARSRRSAVTAFGVLICGYDSDVSVAER